jgi:hypothetical protein
MHFNYGRRREQITQDYADKGVDLFADHGSRWRAYINLCIHPYKWEQVYGSIRENKRIPNMTWNALLGALHGTLVYIKRSRVESHRMCAEIAPDIVEFIRSDSKGDPWKFLLSMMRYFPRYFIMRGLKTFGIDWREVAVTCMGATHKPNPKTYHSLFTGLYIRTLVKAITVYTQQRDIHDSEYELGKNDRHSLLVRESASTKCKGYHELNATVEYLEQALPSWNQKTRAQVAYYLSHALPLHYLVEKQLFGRLETNTTGYKSND